MLGKNHEVTGGEQLVARVQILSEQIEGLSDVHARELAQEMVSAVIELYGDGLERIMAALEQAGPAGGAHRANRSSAPSGVLMVPLTTFSGTGLAGIETSVMAGTA